MYLSSEHLCYLVDFKQTYNTSEYRLIDQPSVQIRASRNNKTYFGFQGREVETSVNHIHSSRGEIELRYSRIFTRLLPYPY